MARSFVQLSLDERRIIARMHEKKISQAEIARNLHRDRSTICRELRRNFWHARSSPPHASYQRSTAQMPWIQDAGRGVYGICTKIGDPLSCKTGMMHLG